jgi:hypothetical protein
MVWDAAVEDTQIRKSLNRFFLHIEERLTAELKTAFG